MVIKEVMKKIVIALLILNIGGCAGSKEEVYFPNGELQFEVDLKGRTRHGVSRTYNDSSILIHLGYWNNGMLTSYKNFFYFSSGSIKQIDSVSGSNKLSHTREFYEDGTLKKSSTLLENQPIGKVSFYYPDGTLKEVDYYDSLGRAYDYEKYNEDGMLKTDTQAAFVDIKNNTVSLGEEVEFMVYMTNNRSKIRVILGLDYDEENRILYDTINYFIPPEGRNDGALVKYMPKKKGELILYGLVQDREDKPNGMIEVGTVPFSEKFYVTD